MREVLVDSNHTYGFVFIENIEEFLKNFEWTKVTIDLQYLKYMTNSMEDFTDALTPVKWARENQYIEIIAAKDKSANKTILLAKPATVKGCFFAIAGVIREEELRVSEEEADAE